MRRMGNIGGLCFLPLRLKYLFMGAKITLSKNITKVHYGEDYPYQEKFNWLMEKLSKVKVVGGRIIPPILNHLKLFGLVPESGLFFEDSSLRREY